MQNLKDKWVFIHIPRTSGTTTITRLREQINPEIFAPHAFWNDYMNSYKSGEIEKYKFFGGHTNYCIKQLISDNVNYITLMRDPIERTISHYNFVTRPGAEHYLKEHIDGMTLTNFVFDDKISQILYNLQTRYIGINVDVFNVAEYNGSLSARMEILPIDDWNKTYETAVERITKEFVFVGLKELHTESLKMFRHFLGLPQLLIEEKPNKNHAANLDSKTLNRIKELTEYDRKLYKVAKKLFFKKLDNFYK